MAVEVVVVMVVVVVVLGGGSSSSISSSGNGSSILHGTLQNKSQKCCDVSKQLCVVELSNR